MANKPPRPRFACWAAETLRKMRFRKKLIISYLIITLIPIVSLGSFSYNMSNSLLNQQLYTMIDAGDKQLAYVLGNRLDKNNEFIRFTAFSPYLMDEFSGKPRNWLSISQKINQYFEPVAWYNMSRNSDYSQMHIYFEYLDVPIGTFIAPSSQVADQEWYISACESPDTNWFFQDGELYAARRIWNAPLDLLLGAVHMKMNFDAVMDSLMATQQNGYGVILTDKEGQVLFTSHAGGAMGDEALSTLIGHAGESVSVDGTQYYVAAQPVPNYDWNLYSFAAIDGFIDQRSQIFYIVVLLIGGCAAILLGLIWVFSTTMVKRLELLSDRMSRIPGLESKNVAPMRFKDEIGLLSDRFGKLLGQVYKSELIQKEEELMALQAQISPHFLYNTLSLIKWKALADENAEIARIASLISTYYRTCLNKGRSLISIEDELGNMESYVNLQLIMHDDGFDVEYDVDPAVLPYNTVNFTLQPLVENAILHGLDENEGVRGRLRIGAELVDGSAIRFVVEDNGVGMDEKTLERILSAESKGYGVVSANKRIKLYFGDDYGVQIFSTPGKGTTAILRIPVQ